MIGQALAGPCIYYAATFSLGVVKPTVLELLLDIEG